MIKVDILVAVAFRGGVEEVINLTARYLNKNGCRVRIIHMLWQGEPWTRPGIEFYTLIDVTKDGWNGDYSLLGNKYAEFISSNGTPDIILAAGWPVLVSVARAVVNYFSLSTPVLSWLHGNLEAYEESGFGGVRELKDADGHIAINDKLVELIEKETGNARIYRVHNPIDREKIRYSDNRSINKLAFVGRLEAEKNLPFLLKTLRIADKQWQLEVVGDGDIEGHNLQTHKDYCRTLGISEKVHFWGWLDNPWSKLEDCAALVIPSVREGSPLVAVEAMLCGMFVISTPTDGMVEKIKPGVNGFLIPFDDEAFFGKLLEMIISGQMQIPAPSMCRETFAEMMTDRPLEEFLNAIKTILNDGVK